MWERPTTLQTAEETDRNTTPVFSLIVNAIKVQIIVDKIRAITIIFRIAVRHYPHFKPKHQTKKLSVLLCRYIHTYDRTKDLADLIWIQQLLTSEQSTYHTIHNNL